MNNTLRLIAGVLITLSLTSCGYNSMVQKREDVNAQWGNVESSYQRRSDLIPNLVNVVSGAANFEKSTLTAVIEARASATSIKIDPSNLTKENIAKFQAAQDQLKGSLSRLLVSVEKYPELRATEEFKALQSQLEGTENRINVERNRFNDLVRDYNAYILGFPELVTAKMFGFTEKEYFQSDKGTEKAPVVKF